MNWKTELDARQTVCPLLRGGKPWCAERTVFCCMASDCGIWRWDEEDTGEHGVRKPQRGRCGLINAPVN